MTVEIVERPVRKRTLHDRHYSAFRVEREKLHRQPGVKMPSKTPWIVHYPTNPCSDYQEQERYATHREAINRAQRMAFRAKLLLDFEAYLDDVQNPWRLPESQHVGLDTMCKTLKWWGKYDLADFLENV